MQKCTLVFQLKQIASLVIIIIIFLQHTSMLVLFDLASAWQTASRCGSSRQVIPFNAAAKQLN
jgi:hypothetical protein